MLAYPNLEILASHPHAAINFPQPSKFFASNVRRKRTDRAAGELRATLGIVLEPDIMHKFYMWKITFINNRGSRLPDAAAEMPDTGRPSLI